jgi:hypothetical protein
MKKIVLFVFLGLFTSGVLAEERKVVLVNSPEDAEQAESGTVLRGTSRIGKENVDRILEIATKHCDLKTFQLWALSHNYWWICEKA